MAKRYRAFFLTLILFFNTCCRPAPEKHVTHTDFLLDTFVTVTLYEDNPAALDGVFALCKEYDAMLDRHREGSEVWNLNHAGGNPLEVSPQLRELVDLAIVYCRLTDGRYDITITPVMDLWDFKAEEPSVPAPEEIAKALELVNWQNVVVEGNRITLHGGAQIDLGSIAKGYIADQLGEYLREQNVTGAIINLGGNVLAIGGKPDGTSFEIGIQQPFDDQELSGRVQVKDKSLVTSGLYERYFELDSRRYHHIIDAKTGYPVESDFDSVTVLSDSSAVGDALSTVCFLVGRQRSEEILAHEESAAAIFLYPDGEVALSAGFGEEYTFTANR